MLIVGDSLSAAYGIALSSSWVHLLQQRLAESGSNMEVVNASISGDTSASGRDRLPTLLARHQPQVVVIELGGNDGLRGTRIATIKENLDAMVVAGKEAGAQVVLLGMRLPPNYGPSYVADFEKIYADLATEHSVALVPFMLEGIATIEGMMQADGIHQSEAAQPSILDNVWPVLKPIVLPANQ